MESIAPGSDVPAPWESSVLRHLLLSEPDAALATQLSGITIRGRERAGPALVIRLRPGAGSFPAARGAVFGGHTFARVDGCSARAAFTLHLDDRGWVSHLMAFLEDDSPWPDAWDRVELAPVSARRSGPDPA
ncbi:MAG: hypothetical protein RIT19_2316 [Verrucomicrobiota bacterium]|jgi:hypothetical protein